MRLLNIVLLVTFFCLTVGIANAGSLTWDPNTESDIAGYNVFDNTVHVATVLHPVASWEIPASLTGTHIFRVSAFDATGNESERSTPAIYVYYPAPEDTTAPAVTVHVTISMGE